MAPAWIIALLKPFSVNTMSALDLTEFMSYPPTLSWTVEASKPDPRIYLKACEACGEHPGEGVIMIGDELKACARQMPPCAEGGALTPRRDYHGAVAAGLEARLIRRQGEWSDGAARHAGEDLTDVSTIASLHDLVAEVESRRQSY